MMKFLKLVEKHTLFYKKWVGGKINLTNLLTFSVFFVLFPSLGDYIFFSVTLHIVFDQRYFVHTIMGS